MKLLFVGCLLLSLGAVGWISWPTAASVGASASLHKDALRLAPAALRLAENIFMLGDLFPSVAYVVKTSDGLALVDSGLETEYEKLTLGLRRLGLDLRQLKIILLTHVHGDHSMGAARLRRETGATIYIGGPDADALRAGGPWEAIYSKFDMDDMDKLAIHPTEIDGELVDGQVISLGDARFSCIATPGHTPGSFCFLLESGETTALFTGDTVTNLNDVLGTYAVTLPPTYGGDLDSYLESLRKLSQLPLPNLVLPGHPFSDPGPRRPRLTEAQWNSLLSRGIAELEEWSARYAKDGADFLDGTPREVASGLYYLGDFDERACYALLTKARSILFDAPGGENAADLVEASWRRLNVPAPPLAAIFLTSCREANTSGLRSLVTRTGCQVVASPEGIESISRLCPDGTKVLAARDLNPLQWEGIEAATLGGRDATSVGYRFVRGDAMVLVSDRMPIEGSSDEFARFRQALSQGDTDGEAFAASLLYLEQLQPDIWLTAQPIHGRNAHLYDDDWRTVLRFNMAFLAKARRPPAPNEE